MTGKAILFGVSD